MKQEAVVAGLESLIQDKRQSYRLGAFATGKATRSLSGITRSVFKGRGMDFDEVREYQQGDDTGQIDWRVTARQGRPFTKLFKEEKEKPVWFLIDLRASMRFATRQAFKSVLVAHITAFIAWAFQERGDKIGGLILTDENVVCYKPSRLRRQMMRFLNAVSEGTMSTVLPEDGQGKTLEEACLKLKRFCKSGNEVFILSDFSDVNSETFNSLSTLARSNEMVMINVFDVLETRFPPPNLYHVTDGKEVLSLNTRSARVQKAYMRFFRKRAYALEDFAVEYGIHYIPVSTEMDVYDAVALGLRKK